MDLQVHSERRGGAARPGSGRDTRPVFAALDLGTNNCRLLIARASGGGFQVIDAFSRIVRLGEGIGRTDRLSDPAMQRTLDALKVCGAKIRRRGATHIRAVATEACRRASNRAEFLDTVERETGIAIETISSEEEARLALAGCRALLDLRRPYALVFDIGGGSTELVWLQVEAGGAVRVLDQTSVRCGVISLTERHGGAEVDAAAYRRMVDEVAETIEAFEERNGIRAEMADGRAQMLGTSGTVTTLAGIHLGLARYDRRAVDGSFLRTDHARVVIRRLLAMDFAARAAHPCIGPDRADLVIAGCAVFQAISECWPAERLRIADRGLREGILMDLIGAEPA